MYRSPSSGRNYDGTRRSNVRFGQNSPGLSGMTTLPFSSRVTDRRSLAGARTFGIAVSLHAVSLHAHSPPYCLSGGGASQLSSLPAGHTDSARNMSGGLSVLHRLHLLILECHHHSAVLGSHARSKPLGAMAARSSRVNGASIWWWAPSTFPSSSSRS